MRTSPGSSYEPRLLHAALNRRDAARAAAVLAALADAGLPGAVTGGLAIDAHLHARGRPVEPRALDDLDLVVEHFNAIPHALAGRFLCHHVHPRAAEGKLLLQLVDLEHALRIDLFRAFGATLARSVAFDGRAAPLRLVAVEDLAARLTAYVVGRLREGRPVDPKFVRAFSRLADVGEPNRLEEAWRDHRQHLSESFAAAVRDAERLVAQRRDLVVASGRTSTVTPCDRCEDRVPFRRARPEAILGTLGYW